MSAAIAGMLERKLGKAGANYAKKVAMNQARLAQNQAKRYAANQIRRSTIAAQNHARAIITKHLGNTPEARALAARVNAGTNAFHKQAIARVNAAPKLF
jgi:hypothetical protein